MKEQKRVASSDCSVWETVKKSYYVKPFTRSDGVRVSGHWRSGDPATDQSQDLSPVYIPPEDNQVSYTPVSDESPEIIVEDPRDYHDSSSVAPDLEPDFEPEFIPEPEVFNDKSVDRLVGDGVIASPDELRQKPAEYRTDYENWKLETETGGSSYREWDKAKKAEFTAIGSTSNSKFMEMNELPSYEWLATNMSKDKRPYVGRMVDIPEGDVVGVRIDIPTYMSTGNFVATIHDDDKKPVGTRLAYENYVRLTGGVTFESSEKAAKRIGKDGKQKNTIAVARGELSYSREVPEDIDQWVPVGYNPKKAVFFYDKRTGEEVLGGDETISYGNTVFVKNAQYTEQESRKRFAGNPDHAFKVEKGYKRGKYVNLVDIAESKSMSSDELLDEVYELQALDPFAYAKLFGDMSPEMVVKVGYTSLFSRILDS